MHVKKNVLFFLPKALVLLPKVLRIYFDPLLYKEGNINKREISA